MSTRYSVSLEVTDEPGVLATIASVFAEHGVSVELVEQSVRDDARTATLVIGTHQAPEAALAATVDALSSNSVVTSVASVIRVEGAQRP